MTNPHPTMKKKENKWCKGEWRCYLTKLIGRHRLSKHRQMRGFKYIDSVIIKDAFKIV